MRIHLLQHVPSGFVTSIERWARGKDHAVSKTLIYTYDNLPKPEDFDWLVIMGGPMSIYDEVSYPWLVNEKKLIANAIENEKIVLGICLGGQLIADVLGGKAYIKTCREIGWYPVSLTEEAKESRIFGRLPDKFTTFFWHEDVFEIPEGCKRMAESEGCRNQAFEYSGRVIGLQFHLECTAESISNMIHCQECIEKIKQGGRYVQSIEEILKKVNYFKETRNVMQMLLDGIEEEYGKDL
jgi:GMP synthase (glutamine-hydrolysing)